MKLDCLLLADIFENFRRSCHKNYKLDPAHYVTLPSFSFDCALLESGMEIELLTDITMINFCEKAVRGGLAQCSKHWAKANNKYMKQYDSSKPPSYIISWDQNNLYGWGLSQPLPYAGFTWIENVADFDVRSIPDDGPYGYFVETNIKYPVELHELHSDYPFCPERLVPPNSVSKNEKLLATFLDKNRYVLHFRNLKQILEHKLEVEILRVLQFKQKPWLASYIEKNTKLRQAAVSPFEANTYKLLSNSIFGKSLENVRRRTDCRLINHWSGRFGLESLISLPNFNKLSVFDENLACVHLNHSVICLNKPIFIGITTLDVTKTLMYDFYYNCLEVYKKSNEHSES
ncbi:hypothetical protein QAD02_013378 [Eretmocerus hayati]|uniref:Uncharacterized protein n=1 Tax=Eretmocerus hayati TaxID=131215 RepID=A0ACC2P448_9HYME|nr:hypothetical protein QAD02_013378 [Eretmocerus hayati]